MKLQLVLGDVYVFQVCKFGTNHAIKSYKCSGKKLCQMSIKRCYLIYEESWLSIQLSMVAYSLII